MRTKQEWSEDNEKTTRRRAGLLLIQYFTSAECLILYCMYMINIQSRFDYNISLLAGCLASLSSALHSATSRSSVSFFC